MGGCIKKARQRKRSQKGGGLSRRFKKRRFVFPSSKLSNKEVKIQQVAPTVAVANRAESDLQQQKEDRIPYVKPTRSPKSRSASIKTKKHKKKSIQSKASKGQRPKAFSVKRKPKKSSRKLRVDLFPGSTIFNRKK